MASTALDIITGALLNINSYAPGETLSPSDASTGLAVLNDLLDSLSNDEAFVYTQQEFIFPWISGQFQYTVGNPVGGQFTGTITTGSTAITGVSALPSNIVATAGTVFGSYLTALSGGIQTGTALVPLNTLVTQIGVPVTFTAGLSGATGNLATVNGVAQTWPYASGTNNLTTSLGQTFVATFTQGSAVVTWSATITGSPTAVATLPSMLLMSLPATLTVSDQITYTVPGNIPMNRPLRFSQGFTRSNTSGNSTLDYTFTFVDFDAYKRELLKNVQGPWPYIASYQPTFPYGNLYVYPAPGSNYTAHIFSDLILAEFANTTTAYSLPQGYSRALKKLLALELAPNYGKTPSGLLITQAKEAKDLIKGTNSTPVKTLQFDTAIVRASGKDASWAQDGGFR